MKTKHYLCSFQQLKDDKYFVKWINEWRDELIVFLNGHGEVKIFSSICPHFGGEIYFDDQDQQLSCKWHDWKFCPDTGKCLTYPIKLMLDAYNFEVQPDKLKEYTPQLNDQDIYAILDE